MDLLFFLQLITRGDYYYIIICVFILLLFIYFNIVDYSYFTYQNQESSKTKKKDAGSS